MDDVKFIVRYEIPARPGYEDFGKPVSIIKSKAEFGSKGAVDNFIKHLPSDRVVTDVIMTKTFVKSIT